MSSGKHQKKATNRIRVLRHIARYRLTIRPVLDRKFFNGKQGASHNVIQELLRSALISQHSIGSFSYYQLTPAAALELGVQATMIKSPGSKLRDYLAILWYCHMLKPSRELLPPDKLKQYFPSARLQAPHCIEPTKAGKPHCLYRVRLAGQNVSDWSLIKDLREYIQKASDPYSEIRPLLLRRLYGFAVLCHDQARATKLKKTVQEKRIPNVRDGSKFRRIPFRFLVVPGPETLGDSIHEHRRNQENK